MLFFDEMSKERKIQKDTEQSEKEWEKQKNTKIQSVFLAAKDKNKKKYKVQGVFFVIFGIYFVFFVFLQKRSQKKIRIQNLQNTKKTNKPKISKIQKSEKCKLNVRKTGQPHVHFRKKHPNRREK